MNDFTTQYPLDENKEYAPWVYEHGLNAPYGECQCACGEDVTIANMTITKRGILRGHPKMFVHGHNRRQPAEERFWRYVDKCGPDDCWMWMASLTPAGYGSFGVDGTSGYAHRYSWELHNGPIPNGLQVCHSCDENYPKGDISYRACCNPRHMWLGTFRDNIKDMFKKQRHTQYDRHGELHPQAKLTESDVLAIRGLHRKGISKKIIARRFGVTPGTIRHVVKRITWKHI